MNMFHLPECFTVFLSFNAAFLQWATYNSYSTLVFLCSTKFQFSEFIVFSSWQFDRFLLVCIKCLAYADIFQRFMSLMLTISCQLMPLILCLALATIWKHVIIMQVHHETVRLMLRQLDPASVINRRQHGRTYHSHGPDDTWHVDGYDNLSRYGFCINGWVSNDYIWYCYIPKWLTYCSDGERNVWWTVLMATTFDALCAI